jgi:hypothetical protein
MRFKQTWPRLAACVMTASALAFAPLEADSSANQGLAVAREADRRDSGWRDFQAEMTMVLGNRFGQKSTRQMIVRGLEVQGDGDKSLTVFQSPADVQGTAFLSFAHRTRSDDQWLYLPSIKRVKRIASDNRSGPFMGSEFAYEDITAEEVEKYTYKYLREANFDGAACHVVERVPVDPDSGYSRQIAYYDIEHYRLQKIEYFDRRGDSYKTLRFAGYRRYLDRYWRAHDMFMENHQTGKTTRLLWKDYRFRTGLGERHFRQNALQRARF